MSGKALAAASFGTARPDALHAIKDVESRLKKAFPEYDFYRTFTSKVVRDKLGKTQNLYIPSPDELIKRLAREGYDEVKCQSLHMMPGVSYEGLRLSLVGFSPCFKRLYLGKPLLWDTPDYLALADALLEDMPSLTWNEAFVYMGHGSGRAADAGYCLMENCFRHRGSERVYVGVMEGFPGLDYILNRLRARKVKCVTLAPFLLTAGGHAQKELACVWKRRLEEAGYDVALRLKGIGEVRGVADIFVGHCIDAEKL